MAETDSPCRKRPRARIRSCFRVFFIDGSSREVPSMLNLNSVFHEGCVKELCTMSWHIFLCTMSWHSSRKHHPHRHTPFFARVVNPHHVPLQLNAVLSIGSGRVHHDQ